MPHPMTRCHTPARIAGCLCLLFAALLPIGCSGPAPLTVELPLHLEEHVDGATVTGSELPANPPQPVEWRFDQPQPDWKATPLLNPPFATAALARTGDGLRVTLTDRTRSPQGILWGGMHVDLPDWDRGDWADVVIRARADSASSVAFVGLRFNLREGRPTTYQSPYQFAGRQSRIVRDGTIQTYRLRADWSWNNWTGTGGAPLPGAGRPWQGPWRQLGLSFSTLDGEPGSIELLSVTVVPKGAAYADSSHGVRPVTIGERIRRTLYVHAPARLSYRVRVPAGGRLDAGLGVLGNNDSVSFRVTVEAGGREESLLDERYADPEQWAQRSVDLAKFAGQTVTLTLETQAEQPGTVALWGAPTVSGARRTDKPNVIFYVIDGGGADQMSVYGYNRRTTPNLERLAGEGALFEHAYSNAPWTKPSTTGFMTSLHNSVLGNVLGSNAGGRFEALPVEARTMAEQFHEAGYSTAVFTSNPWAGSLSSLERGVDLMRDGGVRRDYTSSVELHENYWTWCDAYPAQPYWVHLQTTDVHEYEGGQPAPVAPFSGMYVTAGRRREFWAEWARINAAGGNVETGVEAAGVDRVGFFETMRALYDESLAHQDYQIGRLVERLRDRGEWENTLLIIAADHAIAAALWDLGALMQDTMPPPWNEPMFRSSITRVPLIFVWPGHIEGGRRFEDPVSMIDVLPTVLELAGLPAPEVLQGQSLAPLLLAQAGWHPRPVILDEFVKDPRTGELQGRIEIIDGRWGASLWIGPQPLDTTRRRPMPLLLFDVWNDPLALKVINDAHPELVKKYTALLEKQWAAHRLLAQRFTAGGKVELTPEQLETLRALGYIR